MQQNKSLLPVSIIIAGLLIAGALYFGGNKNAPVAGPEEVKKPVLAEVTAKDHILGNASAPIKLVEYSDPQCHFCKAFHPTMKKIMSEYGAGGKVAWVYRHLAILGPESVKEASATECAADMGGNEKFWQYLDALFDSKEENGRLLASKTLSGIAQEVGLDVTKFNECLDNNDHAQIIATMRDSAIAAGAQGTPYTVLLDSKGKLNIINGAQSYENVKAAIEQALAN
ncbi:MAG: thioredoxin domain-containing protein [Patescibacteria group bacterium]